MDRCVDVGSILLLRKRSNQVEPFASAILGTERVATLAGSVAVAEALPLCVTYVLLWVVG